MKLVKLGSIIISVDDVLQASAYYHHVFGAQPKQKHYHFNTSSFSRSSGFITPNNNKEIKSICLEIPDTGIMLELVKYRHQEKKPHSIVNKNYGNLGITYVCLQVKNIQRYFNFIQSIDEAEIIDYDDHFPLKIDPLKSAKNNGFDGASQEILESIENKNLISDIRNFYFIDRYGVQWEFEEHHAEMEVP